MVLSLVRLRRHAALVLRIGLVLLCVGLILPRLLAVITAYLFPPGTGPAVAGPGEPGALPAWIRWLQGWYRGRP